MNDKKSQFKQSRFGRKEADGQNRFLRLKYIIVRDNDFEKYNQRRSNNQLSEKGIGATKLEAIRGAELGFPLPRFTTY